LDRLICASKAPCIKDMLLKDFVKGSGGADSELNDLINFSALEQSGERRIRRNVCAYGFQHLIALAGGASLESASEVRGRLTFTTSALLSLSLDGVAGELRAASVFSEEASASAGRKCKGHKN
jgi:hypothetical protein